MKPRERVESGQGDLFWARLDQILDMGYAKVVLARTIDGSFVAETCGAAYSDKAGRHSRPLSPAEMVRKALACKSRIPYFPL